MNWLMYTFSFAMGAAVGSFLNVCIYRLPREMSLAWPPSHCPACGQGLAWYDNVPLVSFLLLGGKCRHCGVIIAGRYALVELLTALLFLATVHHFAGHGQPVQAGVALVVVSALIAGSFVDIERRIIPDEITLAGLAAGCLAGLVFPQIHAGDVLLRAVLPGGLPGGLPGHLAGLGASAFGAAVGAAFIYLTGVLGRMLFRKEAMGLGDVKLMAMVGAFMGWRTALMTVFLGCVLGAVIGAGILLASARTGRRRDTHIPFGPYLSMGAIAFLFFEPQVFGVLALWQGLFSAP